MSIGYAAYPLAQPGRLAGGVYAPSARRRLASFVGRLAHLLVDS